MTTQPNNTAPLAEILPRDTILDHDASGLLALTAQQAVLPRQLEDGKLYAVLDADGAVQLLETPGYTDRHTDARADAPRDITRSVTLLDVYSFVDYLARNTFPAGINTEEELDPLLSHVVGANCAANAGALELWADIDQRKILAILDGIYGWRKHTATLQLKLSREWAEWAAIDGKLLKQAELAQFVEDHLSTIAEPSGALLLDICQTLQATTSTQFKQQAILANGQRQFRYEETVEAKAGSRGDITIPAALSLVLRPFQGSQPVVVTARFRFQIRDGVLSLGVKLAEPDLALEEAFNQVVDDVQANVPVRVNHGRP